MDFNLSSLPLPVRLRPATPWSDAKLLQFCAANEALRVEREPNGDLSIMTPVGFSTTTMNERITRMLGNWAEEDGRGVSAGPDAGFTLLDGSMRSPDASWMSHAKIAAMTEEERDRFASFCPEFVIELRSPSDRPGAVKKKMKMWTANGTELAWLIEPKQRKVTVFHRGADPEVFFDPSSVQGDGPVQGFELVMARVWG